MHPEQHPAPIPAPGSTGGHGAGGMPEHHPDAPRPIRWPRLRRWAPLSHRHYDALRCQIKDVERKARHDNDALAQSIMDRDAAAVKRLAHLESMIEEALTRPGALALADLLYTVRQLKSAVEARDRGSGGLRVALALASLQVLQAFHDVA